MGNSLARCCNSIIWLLILIFVAWPIACAVSALWLLLQVRLNKHKPIESILSSPPTFFLALRKSGSMSKDYQQLFGAISHLAKRMWQSHNEWHLQLSTAATTEQNAFRHLAI
jgi:hypothetical protein